MERELFQILKILLLSSQCIFSLTMFVVNNNGLFRENSELYNITTRNNSNLYQPLSDLVIIRKDLTVSASRGVIPSSANTNVTM
jgi:hypothetical protein